MLDQTKAQAGDQPASRHKGFAGALTRAEARLGLNRRWTPRIIILSGLVLAVLCDAFVAHMLSVNYRETYRTIKAANGDLARALEEYMLRNIQGVDVLLSGTINNLAKNPALLTAGNPALIDELKQRVAPYPIANAIVVLDADGKLLGDSLGNGGPGREQNFADRTYYKAQRDDPGRGLFIDVPVFSRVRNSLVLVVSRAFLTPEGRFGGIVFVPIDYENLRQFFLSLNVGQRGTVTLYRDDGTILLRTPNADEFAGRDVRSNRLFTYYLPQAPSGSFEGSGMTDGTSRSISYRRVAGMPLVVTIARDPVEFLAGWKNNALYYSVIAAGLNLLIAGFGFGLARQWRLRATSEQALRDNLEQHQLVTENVPALIVHVLEDGRIRYANRVARDWYAAPSTDAICGRKIEDFIDPSHLDEARAKIEAALAGRTTGGEEKTTFPDGRERWCETIRVPDCRQDGKVRGYFVLSVDITERKRIEDELRQAQKMEAIGQLAGGIAHDSNNMLAATLGNLDLLLDTLPPAEVSARSLAERAAEAAERVADLNRRLLAFARKQTLRPQVTDVNQLVCAMTTILQRTLGETIEIEVAQDPMLWQCLIDPTQLQNALLNLALNARDAMAGQGRLTITTANAVLDQPLDDGDERIGPGEYVTIAVADRGAGMSPEIARRAFEPFFTTKEFGKGSGLGLSMVYGFARQSGGTAVIASQVGQGTQVTLYLPSAGPGASGEARAGTTRLPRPDRAERILVVEDNPLVGAMASTMLSSMGYSPVVVVNAAAAIAELERPEPVALLLTDIVLPDGVTGIDLARQVRHRWPELPIVFMSGFADPSLVPEDFRATTKLLAKPFRLGQLSEAIVSSLAGRPAAGRTAT
ncbi:MULTISPECIES: ATP-binding protein [Bradyrhizobium]|jgi:PAS domain S-box-containing protein|uniref:histidine kinase n=6 Tax=Bradyrhizobium TaxID=374 RepID=A0ABS5FZV7_9BRAD|nr:MULTISPECIES: ATP-binding protein [Bradyrhizobium]RTM04263.1 MAG: PAS domain S-box protein [Bradyrhizobiaceae bacterium]MBR1134515.1 PAS domain-containing protein [Bradyrhizobium denitrificans]MCL8486959.1 PAS domain-containing protein [Bradyrhizobium denitrificans]MDU1491997.1 PAS domain-containing protein [Bradyrhizobium sp.]MDU1542022.1 PAS domain-containing protein [Bradyrhizobium sp.]